MVIDLKKDQKGVILSLSGIVASQDASKQFALSSKSALTEKCTYVVLDFSGSSLPDSRFISRMVEFYHDAKNASIQIYLFCGENEENADLFRHTHINKLMPLIKSYQDIVS